MEHCDKWYQSRRSSDRGGEVAASRWEQSRQECIESLQSSVQRLRDELRDWRLANQAMYRELRSVRFVRKVEESADLASIGDKGAGVAFGESSSEIALPIINNEESVDLGDIVGVASSVVPFHEKEKVDLLPVAFHEEEKSDFMPYLLDESGDLDLALTRDKGADDVVGESSGEAAPSILNKEESYDLGGSADGESMKESAEDDRLQDIMVIFSQNFFSCEKINKFVEDRFCSMSFVSMCVGWNASGYESAAMQLNDCKIKGISDLLLLPGFQHDCSNFWRLCNLIWSWDVGESESIYRAMQAPFLWSGCKRQSSFLYQVARSQVVDSRFLEEARCLSTHELGDEGWGMVAITVTKRDNLFWFKLKTTNELKWKRWKQPRLFVAAAKARFIGGRRCRCLQTRIRSKNSQCRSDHSGNFWFHFSTIAGSYYGCHTSYGWTVPLLIYDGSLLENDPISNGVLYYFKWDRGGVKFLQFTAMCGNVDMLCYIFDAIECKVFEKMCLGNFVMWSAMIIRNQALAVGIVHHEKREAVFHCYLHLLGHFWNIGCNSIYLLYNCWTTFGDMLSLGLSANSLVKAGYQGGNSLEDLSATVFECFDEQPALGERLVCFRLFQLQDGGISTVEIHEDNEAAARVDYETLLFWVLVDPSHRHGFCRRVDFTDERAVNWMVELSQVAKVTIKLSKVLSCNGYVFYELSPVLICSAVEFASDVGIAAFFDHGPQGKTLSCDYIDVCKMDDVKRFFEVAELELGLVAICINNVGTAGLKFLMTFSTSDAIQECRMSSSGVRNTAYWSTPSTVIEVFEAKAAKISAAYVTSINKASHLEERFSEYSLDLIEAVIDHRQLTIISFIEKLQQGIPDPQLRQATPTVKNDYVVYDPWKKENMSICGVVISHDEVLTRIVMDNNMMSEDHVTYFSFLKILEDINEALILNCKTHIEFVDWSGNLWNVYLLSCLQSKNKKKVGQYWRNSVVSSAQSQNHRALECGKKYWHDFLLLKIRWLVCEPERLIRFKDHVDLGSSDAHMPDMDRFKLFELIGLEMDLPILIYLFQQNDAYLSEHNIFLKQVEWTFKFFVESMERAYCEKCMEEIPCINRHVTGSPENKDRAGLCHFLDSFGMVADYNVGGVMACDSPRFDVLLPMYKRRVATTKDAPSNPAAHNSITIGAVIEMENVHVVKKGLVLAGVCGTDSYHQMQMVVVRLLVNHPKSTIKLAKDLIESSGLAAILKIWKFGHTGEPVCGVHTEVCSVNTFFCELGSYRGSFGIMYSVDEVRRLHFYDELIFLRIVGRKDSCWAGVKDDGVVAPNTSTFCLLVESSCKVSDFAPAPGALEVSLKVLGQKYHVHAVLLSELLQKRVVLDANKFMLVALERGIGFEGFPSKSLVQALCKEDRPKGAVHILSRLTNRDYIFHSAVIMFVIDELYKEGRKCEAAIWIVFLIERATLCNHLKQKLTSYWWKGKPIKDALFFPNLELASQSDFTAPILLARKVHILYDGKLVVREVLGAVMNDFVLQEWMERFKSKICSPILFFLEDKEDFKGG